MYFGNIDGKQGFFVGVKLNHKIGKNDGSFQGKHYFKCASGFGIFVPPEHVRLHGGISFSRKFQQPPISSTVHATPTPPQPHQFQQQLQQQTQSHQPQQQQHYSPTPLPIPIQESRQSNNNNTSISSLSHNLSVLTNINNDTKGKTRKKEKKNPRMNGMEILLSCLKIR